MNSKLCKRLRRLAEAKTVGLPDAQLDCPAGVVRVDARTRKRVPIRNERQTTRGVYRAFKHAAQRIARGEKLK